MIDRQGLSPKPPREQELELEIARLTAELNTAQGEDPTVAISRFLAMAASTVDRAVADARREADEIAEEISSQAEARRDEATRLAAEAETTAARLRAEASQSQDVVTRAEDAAEAIRASAIEEASELIAVERGRVVDELEALTEVRLSLEEERGALESYHDELRRRVKELAESMVSFMTTEAPIAAGSAIENLIAPELDTGADLATAEIEAEPVVAETVPEDDHEAGDVRTDDIEADGRDHEIDEIDEIEQIGGVVEAEVVAAGEFGGVSVVAESTGPAREYDPFDPHSAGPAPDLFDLQPNATPAEAAGLFSAATAEETERGRSGSLFGAHGARLLQQAPPDRLAEALADEDSEEDTAFREFIEGDDSPDPSRDWLLRPEQS